jgi:hypothetical protein
MHSINSAVKSDTTIDSVIQLPAGDGSAISTIGTDDLFVSLRLRRLGELIELVSELTIYSARMGRYYGEELDREVTDDEDDAINIAIDMQWTARKRLDELDAGEDIIIEPRSFGEAVEAFFDDIRAAQPAIAAE